MARFKDINYEYYDSDNKLLGTSNGFLSGLKDNPDSMYVKKYIDGQYSETIQIYACELKSNET